MPHWALLPPPPRAAASVTGTRQALACDESLGSAAGSTTGSLNGLMRAVTAGQSTLLGGGHFAAGALAPAGRAVAGGDRAVCATTEAFALYEDG